MKTDVPRKSIKTPDYQIRYIKKPNTPHENFARIHRSLYESKRYRNLSPTAKDIYTGIMLACNKGNMTRCIFPKSAYEKITTKPTFHKAKKELIENGFIYEMSCWARPSIYTLSDAWMLDEIPRQEPIFLTEKQYDQIIKGIKNLTSEESN